MSSTDSTAGAGGGGGAGAAGVTGTGAGRSVFASRLGFAFALVAAMTAILAGVISYAAWSWQFDRYVQNNLQETANNVARRAADAYLLFNGWNFSPSTFAHNSRADIALQVLDSTGAIIYDEPSQIVAQLGLSGVPKTSEGEVMLDPASNAVTTAQVVVNSVVVGEVRVWVYGSDGLLTAHDLQMRSSSLLALGIAGFIAIIGATVVGAIYARRLVRPIRRMTTTAAALRDGAEDARCGLSGDDEIAQLGMTFDRMADSIQSDRARERRLTGDVAHELRTPLMGIQATVEALEDGVYPADSQHLSIISRETRRLTGLTNTILELSRLESASEQFSMQRIDLDVPVRASLDLHAALLESAGLRLEVALEPHLFVSGDGEKLQQAIANFLTNAARYTPEGGTVTVRTFAAGDKACVSVSDTGMGISPADKERIFARFWRADSARSRASGGIGVGLTITKEIVDRHQGEITVDSRPGAGTTFTIKLPFVT